MFAASILAIAALAAPATVSQLDLVPVARVGRMRDGKIDGESVFKGIYFKELYAPTHPKHFFSLARRP